MTRNAIHLSTVIWPVAGDTGVRLSTAIFAFGTALLTLLKNTGAASVGGLFQLSRGRSVANHRSTVTLPQGGKNGRL